MSRSQSTWIIASLLAVLALPWLARWRASSQLRQEIQMLQRQVEEVPQLRAEQERLSNLLARATISPKPATPPARELMKLRGMVGLLRQQTNELARVAAENFRASAALLELAKSAVGKEYARDSWSYAGYDKPEDAVQSTVWATRTGNWQQVLASGTPAFRAYNEKQLKESKEGFAESVDELATKVKEYRITESSVISEDMVVLYAWFEYFEEQDGKHGYGAPLYLKKLDGQWKLDEP